MARDAQLAGDRVQTEYYLQYADHYFRVLGESRARFEEQRRQRGDDSTRTRATRQMEAADSAKRPTIANERQERGDRSTRDRDRDRGDRGAAPLRTRRAQRR